MSDTKIPGLCALHAIITPTCRANRGDDGALEEAFDRIRRAYAACVEGRGDGANYRVALVVEPLEPVPEP